MSHALVGRGPNPSPAHQGTALVPNNKSLWTVVSVAIVTNNQRGHSCGEHGGDLVLLMWTGNRSAKGRQRCYSLTKTLFRLQRLLKLDFRSTVRSHNVQQIIQYGKCSGPGSSRRRKHQHSVKINARLGRIPLPCKRLLTGAAARQPQCTPPRWNSPADETTADQQKTQLETCFSALWTTFALVPLNKQHGLRQRGHTLGAERKPSAGASQKSCMETVLNLL